EGAGLQGALPGLRLHVIGAGNAGLQRLQHALGDFVIGGEGCLNAPPEGLSPGRIRAEIGHVPAAFSKILVTGGALLTIPSLLVDEYNRSEQGKPLDCEGQVGEVGNGAMAVLEIKCVEELLGALAADFPERLAHGESR